MTDSWTFSSHADVLQALSNLHLVMPGQGDIAASQALKSSVARAMPPARLAAWQHDFIDSAQALVDALPEGRPVDLVTALAEPWSLGVALTVTGAPPGLADEAGALAGQIFRSAAQAMGAEVDPDAQQAAVALHRLLSAPPAAPGRWADVQTFVALSQSLPALLANAWLALLEQPDMLADLLADPSRLAAAAGELLRLGSPARAVFRQAVADTQVGITPLRRGDGVTLLLWEANRDPTRFPGPDRLHPGRDTGPHLGLGGGLHHCPGAALVRQALLVITGTLLQRSASLAWATGAADAVIWRGGFALRAAAALPVVRLARKV